MPPMIGIPFWIILCFTPFAQIVVTVLPRQPWTCNSTSRPLVHLQTRRLCPYPNPNGHRHQLGPRCPSQLRNLMSPSLIDPLPCHKRSTWRDLSITAMQWRRSPWKRILGPRGLKNLLCTSFLKVLGAPERMSLVLVRVFFFPMFLFYFPTFKAFSKVLLIKPVCTVACCGCCMRVILFTI